MTNLINASQTCTMCIASRLDPDIKGILRCHLEPPQVLAINANGQLQFISQHPPTKPDGWCIQFRGSPQMEAAQCNTSK
jgi:hypothetical protein